jgi:hypothetical protein
MAVQQVSIRDEIYEFLASGPTPAQIVAFHPSAAAQQRANDLLERNRSNALSAQDRNELDDLVRLEDMMRILKAKARKHI